jgi:hypothetical protein
MQPSNSNSFHNICFLQLLLVFLVQRKLACELNVSKEIQENQVEDFQIFGF